MVEKKKRKKRANKRQPRQAIHEDQPKDPLSNPITSNIHTHAQ